MDHIIASLHISKTLDLLSTRFPAFSPAFPIAAKDIALPDPDLLFICEFHACCKGALLHGDPAVQLFPDQKFPQVFLTFLTAAYDGNVKISPHITVQFAFEQIHPSVKRRRLSAVDADQFFQERRIFDSSCKGSKNIARLFVEQKIVLFTGKPLEILADPPS